MSHHRVSNDEPDLEIVEISGASPGPTLAVLGGVHGDELEGVVAARLFAARLTALVEENPTSLRGTVKILPVSHRAAFEAGTRCSPDDGANLARVFPGSVHGSPTERLAAAITVQMIEGADLLVDLHSAGAYYEMPVFVGCVVDGPTGGRSLAAAEAFDAPVTWVHDTSNPGRSLSAARALGVPSIYVEGSGGGGLVGADIAVYTHGLDRLLVWLGMVDDASEPSSSSTTVIRGDAGDVDASLACDVDGYCVTWAASGTVVAEGQLLAEILDEDGQTCQVVRSPAPGTVMMIRRRARISRGEGVVMLGPLPDHQTASDG